MRIKCVRCEVELKLRELGGVQVDICHKCNGMFWDAGEMNKVVDCIEGDLEYSTVAGDSFAHSDEYPKVGCPRCKDKEMKKVDFNVYTEIILDYCPSCNGFWADGGELHKMNREIKHIKEVADRATSPTVTNIANFFWNIKL